MFELIVNHPFISLAIYLTMVLIMLVYFHACSKASGNDEDPYRDEGNGGASIEASRVQYERDQQEKADRRFLKNMSKVL